jgi:hypothetical protein
MFEKFRQSRLNILTYGCLAALGVFFVLFKLATGFGGGASWQATAYYFSQIGRSLEYLAVGGAYFAAMLLIFLVIASQVRNFAVLARRSGGRPMMFGSETLLGALRNGGRTIGKALLTMLPAFLFIILLSFTLDGLNGLDRARLVDAALLGPEHALFGGYVFVALGSIHYPAFLIRFIIFSFENMSGILLLSAFLLAYFSMRLLREQVASFCFAMILMVPLWFAFPALSPQDRFVDNVYHLPIMANIAVAITAYHPGPQIADFLASVRAGKNGLANMPTSTMPSAHAVWAVLAGFYLFRAKKWLGWIALPFLAASFIGTVILAQHYFLDVLFGLAIAAFAIWVVEKLAGESVVSVPSVIPAEAGIQAPQVRS